MTTASVFLVIAIVILVITFKTAIVVPQQNAYVVESLGKYSKTLPAGFHILIPFVDVVRYRLEDCAPDLFGALQPVLRLYRGRLQALDSS